MMAKQTTKGDEIREFQADHQWIEQHRASLLSQYPDQWIAVKDRTVVASDSDLERLLAILADPAHTAVEFLGLEPIEMIL
jgi:uncharacterized protein DUF5678